MLLALWSGFWDWGGKTPEPDNGWLGGGIYQYGQVKKATKAKSIVEQVIEAYEREQDSNVVVKQAKQIEKLAPQAPKLQFEEPLKPQLVAIEVYLERYIEFLIQQEEEEFILLAALV